MGMSTTTSMTKIFAWIRNPANNLFKGMSKRCALFVLSCENPEACDLYVKEKSCLHQGATQRCPFGRKSCNEGPTNRSVSFYSTMQKWREANADVLNALKPLKAQHRIFRANGKYYLPYHFMDKGWHDGGLLENRWISEEHLTTEFLEKLCNLRPRAMMGGEITSYQKEEVPKFISDLKHHYPEIFERLPDDQKARVETISYVGRKADLTTCNPSEFTITGDRWEWDGKTLIGKKMLFQSDKRFGPPVGEKVTESAA
jgi:hypothetical protein